MRLRKTNRLAKRKFALGLAIALAVTALMDSGLVSAARTQDSRPRRYVGPQVTPSPTSTPAPVTQTVPSQSVSRPAASSVATPTPTPTPRAAAQPTPYDRIAPQLGEPPPAPILKPKPTPEPTDEDFDEGSTLKINTELVTLNVRVIDRNNRPIDNVRQN